MHSFLHDARYGLRMLAKTPGTTVVAVLTLAIGIGANVAIFSFVDELWLRPMPVPEPNRVIRVFTSNRSSGGEIERGLSSYPDFLDIQRQVKSLHGVAAFESRGALFDDGAGLISVRAAVISDNFFELMQPKPAVGRIFTASEIQAPGALPVMLSYPFWRRQFNEDASLVGRTIILDRQQVAVVGILPRGFRSTDVGSIQDVWIPMSTWDRLVGDRQRLGNRGRRSFELFARLQPTASVQAANAELATIAADLARAFPESNAGRRITAVPDRKVRRESSETYSQILLGIAATVLLIACANVASLLLARGEYRRHEVATRFALGASRSRVVRQLLTETALLAAVSMVAALLLAQSIIGMLPGLLPQTSSPPGFDPQLNTRVLLFAFASAFASLFLFGLFPAWRFSSVGPVSALKQRGAETGGVRALARSCLVATQVALSLVLAVSAGLLVRSLLKLQALDPGFDAHQNMLVFNDLVPGFGTKDDEGSRQFVAEARRRIEALPGVVGTTVAMRIPFGASGGGATRKIFVPGTSGTSENDGVPIHYDPIADRFFEILGTRVLHGRAVDARDVETHARVMVVNQTMARRFWPNQDAIGQRVRLDQSTGKDYEVIGVVEDGKYNDFSEDTMPYLYVPMRRDEYGELAMAIKTRVDPTAVAEDVRRTMREINPNVAAREVGSLRQHMRDAMYDQRMTAGLITTLGLLGVLLAAVGLYGLMSFLVGRRTQEIGIRVALGAQPTTIFRLIVGRAVVLTACGMVVGAAGALAVTRALRSLLFGITATDALSFAMAVVLLGAVAAAASFVPALRATKVDPMVALRYE